MAEVKTFTGLTIVQVFTLLVWYPLACLFVLKLKYFQYYGVTANPHAYVSLTQGYMKEESNGMPRCLKHVSMLVRTLGVCDHITANNELSSTTEPQEQEQ